MLSSQYFRTKSLLTTTINRRSMTMEWEACKCEMSGFDADLTATSSLNQSATCGPNNLYHFV